jgi:hypothetical protein
VYPVETLEGSVLFGQASAPEQDCYVKTAILPQQPQTPPAGALLIACILQMYRCTAGVCSIDETGTYPTEVACQTACNPTPPSPPSPQPSNQSGVGTGGEIMLVFFLGLLFPYFAAGILFQKYRRNASGTALVPHLTFWTAIPGLVQDGLGFVCWSCKQRAGLAMATSFRSYEEL